MKAIHNEIEQLESEARISEEMKDSLAYKTLTNEAKIILLILLRKNRPDYAAEDN